MTTSGIEHHHGPSAGLALFISFIVLGALAIAEFWTPPFFSLTPFYLLNVALVSWAYGRTWGLFFALLASGSQLLFARTDGWEVGDLPYFYLNHVGALIAYVAIAILIASMRSMYEREQTHARLDFLTSTLNRRGFHEALGAEIARSGRTAKPLSVAYMDFDNFKALNDSIGHAAGDDALTTVAATAKAMLRISDRIGRMGGDEFALIFPDTDGQGAAEAVNKLRQQLDERMSDKGYDLVTFSFGLVTFTTPPSSPQAVLALCDSLMYEAKSGGKQAMVQRAIA